jgi:epoxyqueuosine reductase
MISIQNLLTQYQKHNVVDIGYTEATGSEYFSEYVNWVNQNNHLPLKYLEGEKLEKREDLKNYWQDCESSLVFLFSYKNIQSHLSGIYSKNKKWNGLKIASYTLGFDGEDYHNYIAKILNQIGSELQREFPGLEFKLALDTQAVIDRDLAFRSGLGWFGKNSMFISRKFGSFTIIGSLLLNQKLPLSQITLDVDHCGQCNKCIEACPTNAIDPQSRTIVAKDCISTFTIEQFKMDSIPSEKMSLMSGYVFGCDICQEVCPWNKRIDRYNISEINLNDRQNEITNYFLFRDKNELYNQLNNSSERSFRNQFKNTSFERSGKRGILKNLIFYFKELNIFS